MVQIKKDKLLLKPEDIKPSSNNLEVIGVLNPAAVRLPNGKVFLYVRVIERLKKFKDSKAHYSPRCMGKDKYKLKIDRFPKSSVLGSDDFGIEFKNKTKRLTFISHLRRIILDKDGFGILSIDKKPSFYGLENDAELGVEDARITEIHGKYYMTYVGLTRKESISTNLAVSSDLKNWKRIGIIFGEQDKDVVLLPDKFKGEYIAFDRPEGNFQFSPPHIWTSCSKDLVHWGHSKTLNVTKGRREFERSGAGPPPIKIHGGWLFLFHAVSTSHPQDFLRKLKKIFGFEVEDGHAIYATWAALLNPKNPREIIKRSHIPVMVPMKKYEVSLEGKRVVFPTGLIWDRNKEDLLIYSGAGDLYVTAKKIALSEILKTLRRV